MSILILQEEVLTEEFPDQRDKGAYLWRLTQIE